MTHYYASYGFLCPPFLLPSSLKKHQLSPQNTSDFAEHTNKHTHTNHTPTHTRTHTQIEIHATAAPLSYTHTDIQTHTNTHLHLHTDRCTYMHIFRHSPNKTTHTNTHTT